MPARGVALPLLRELRLLEALTQEELGARAGVARSSIARIENGATAGLGTARRLARALRVTAADLMGAQVSAGPAQRVAEARARYQVRTGRRPGAEGGAGKTPAPVAA
jgi:transcriptional regulator with XRE-family HTH domain